MSPKYICYLVFPFLLFPSGSIAQSTAITSHWGGTIFPTFEPRKEISLHFFGFTEFGKEVDSNGNYIFKPYNDLNNTLGFNVLSFSNTRAHDRELLKSNLMKRNIVTIGYLNDFVTEWLQNEVIHKGNLRGELLRIPRRRGEEDESIKPAENDPWPPIIGFSQEFNLRFRSRSRVGNQSGIQYRPIPFFIGSGWSLSTINQEAFFQIGAVAQEVELPSGIRPLFSSLGISGLSGGTILRSGILLPGVILEDLTSGFTMLQGNVKLHWRVFDFPFTTELLVSNHSGFFVEKRTQEVIDEIQRLGNSLAEVYESKLSKRERYISFKIEVGKFIFESYNDTFGGKDQGPSFGANMSVIISTDDLSKLFGLL